MSEAAGILGVSTQTVRRMVKRGRLEGQRVHRPQGSAFLVSLPAEDGAGDTDATATQQPAGNVSRSKRQEQAGTPELMAAWSETFLGPIMARMAEQETTIREQAETIGREAAELAALRAQSTTLAPSESTERPDLTRRSHPGRGGGAVAGDMDDARAGRRRAPCRPGRAERCARRSCSRSSSPWRSWCRGSAGRRWRGDHVRDGSTSTWVGALGCWTRAVCDESASSAARILRPTAVLGRRRRGAADRRRADALAAVIDRVLCPMEQKALPERRHESWRRWLGAVYG